MDNKTSYPRLHAAGEGGLLIEFGPGYDPKINQRVNAFDRLLSRQNLAGVRETMPSFRSLLLRFDPLTTDFDALKAEASALLAEIETEGQEQQPPKRFILPVVYGGDFGPDLAEVAELTGIPARDIPEFHATKPLDVAMIGFSPGLAYLGQMGPVWDIPRATELRPRVPVGAILVAVRQTVLPATPIPTGWRQIGQTPFRSFQPEEDHPFLLSPGDQITFSPISPDAFDRPWRFEAGT